MASNTIQAFYLGIGGDFDANETDTQTDSAAALVGFTFGSSSAPLYDSIDQLTLVDNNDDGTITENDNGQTADFIHFGSSTAALDSVTEYNVLLTYADGTTATTTMFLVQDTAGRVFLTPSQEGDSANDPLQAQPIQSIQLASVADDNLTGIDADLDSTSFSDGEVDGTSGDDTIGPGYTDADGTESDASTGNDTINANGGDDTVDGGAGNDQIQGGTGNDSLQGGAGNDTIRGDTDPDGTAQQVSINATNVRETGQGFNVTAQNISGGTLSDASADNVVVFTGGGFGVSGAVSNNGGSASEQIGFDDASGQSETLTINFDDPVTDASFNFAHLWTDMKGETGHYAIYNDGVLVHEGDFTEDTPNSGTGHVDISGFGEFDQLVFTAVQIPGGTEASDYTVTDVTFTPADPADQDADDYIDGGDGDDLIYGDYGQDTILGGTGDDTIYGGTGPDSSTGIGGSDQPDENFTVISLGTFADIDTDETNGNSENAASLLGSYGGGGAELYNNFQSATVFDTNNNNVLNDNDFNGTGETITIGGVDYQIDSTQVYNATVTFDDGTTGNFTAVVFQTTTGETFMAPELSNNADNALLTSKPIQSISLDSVATDNTNLSAPRLDANYQQPTTQDESDDQLSGGAGNDQIYGGAGDDTLSGGADDDDLDGGTGSDTIDGGSGDDQITVSQGDSVSGGDGDDYFILQDLDEAGNDSISIVGGDNGETNGDTLQLTPDVTFDDITFTNTPDPNDGLTGNFTLADGTFVSFSGIENIICFTAGTQILTQLGDRTIDDLRPGDMVVTRDHGLQPIRWIGKRTVQGHGKFAPVSIGAGVVDGARGPLLVSPQHRILFTGYQAQLLFAESEVLISAKHLVDNYDVRICPQDQVTYIHIMFDRHEVIYAQGIASESFHAGDIGLSAISDPSRDELFSIFPELRTCSNVYGSTARPCLKKHEAALIATL